MILSLVFLENSAFIFFCNVCVTTHGIDFVFIENVFDNFLVIGIFDKSHCSISFLFVSFVNICSLDNHLYRLCNI